MGRKTAEKHESHEAGSHRGWLLFFYTVPSKPVNNRIKLWRRLASAGAVQLKGAVYVLPHTEEHYEFCQWLMAEVSGLGGEGDFVAADHFEMLGSNDIIALFRNQRDADYAALGKKLGELEVRLSSMEKGSTVKNRKSMRAQLDRLLKEHADIQAIDFYPSDASRAADEKIGSLRKRLALALKPEGGKETEDRKSSVPRRSPDDYQGKVWVTRKNPFVDRMASAWLIRKFIDRDALFHAGHRRN